MGKILNETASWLIMLGLLVVVGAAIWAATNTSFFYPGRELAKVAVAADPDLGDASKVSWDQVEAGVTKAKIQVGEWREVQAKVAAQGLGAHSLPDAVDILISRTGAVPPPAIQAPATPAPATPEPATPATPVVPEPVPDPAAPATPAPATPAPATPLNDEQIALACRLQTEPNVAIIYFPTNSSELDERDVNELRVTMSRLAGSPEKMRGWAARIIGGANERRGEGGREIKCGYSGDTGPDIDLACKRAKQTQGAIGTLSRGLLRRVELLGRETERSGDDLRTRCGQQAQVIFEQQ